MRLAKQWIIGLLTLGCLTAVTGTASAQKHALFHLHHALWEMREARKELVDSRWQFGEHKVRAERAIDDGIKQIELILRNVGDVAKGEPTKADLREFYKKYPHHPRLHHAVVELRHAHMELGNIKYDFGGHKKAALRDIEIAANQIELLLRNAQK